MAKKRTIRIVKKVQKTAGDFFESCSYCTFKNFFFKSASFVLYVFRQIFGIFGAFWEKSVEKRTIRIRLFQN